MLTFGGIQEFYGNGTAATTLKCDGERDPQCSAGDGAVGINTRHLMSFGVTVGFAGCS